MVAYLLLVVALAGCGGEAADLSDPAARDLQARVGQVRAAASAGDRAGVATALAGLRSAVAQHRSQGQVGEERAAGILSAAADVEANLSLLPAPPPPQTTTTVRRAPEVRPGGGGEEEKEEEEKKGNGKKGKGDD